MLSAYVGCLAKLPSCGNTSYVHDTYKVSIRCMYCILPCLVSALCLYKRWMMVHYVCAHVEWWCIMSVHTLSDGALSVHTLSDGALWGWGGRLYKWGFVSERLKEEIFWAIICCIHLWVRNKQRREITYTHIMLKARVHDSWKYIISTNTNNTPK